MGRRVILLIAAVIIAVLGGVLIFMYVQGVNQRAQEQQQPVQVLTAKVQINTGETVEAAQAAAKFQLTSVARNDVLPGALTSTDAIKGEIALYPIYPGEQILPNKFGTTPIKEKRIDIPEGDVAISIQLGDPQRVAGFVEPGSEVAIFVSMSGAQNTDQTTAGATQPTQPAAPTTTAAAAPAAQDFTRILLPKVLVIAVGSTTTVPQTTTDQSGNQTTQQVSTTILTVGVSQDEAQKIIYAQGHGSLTLALLDDKSAVQAGPGADNDNLFLAAK
jgi:pilus assembly protein CpaB